MTTTDPSTESDLAIAPGSVVVVRDEEWLVRETEQTADGLLVHVQGLTELVRDTRACFYQSLDDIRPLDPRAARVVADDSPRYRRSRVWLDSMFRRTPLPLADPTLTVSTRALADPLAYQRTAVRKVLDPSNIRPRVLLADAVGLGKTLEIGMILSELVRRGRGERILIVSPRHVLEQMQREMWARFALPFVRLDSAGIQQVRQKLPATRNPFTYYKRVIVSIDTLKSDRYVAGLQQQRWDAVVIDESHNLANSLTLNNRLARILARNSEALILASATPHNGRKDSFAELIRLLDPAAVPAGGDLPRDAVERLVVRRHRHSPEVAGVVGNDWAERLPPNNILIPASPAEDAVAHELADRWLFPGPGGSPYSGARGSLFPWTLAKAMLSSPAALAETIQQRLQRLDDSADAEAERHALKNLGKLTADAVREPSAKYLRLVQHLRQIGVGRGSATRAVVFAERIATLKDLQKRLPKDLGLTDDAVRIMHGGLPDDQQQDLMESFKQAGSEIRVLVTGDVASEGVNLHVQCHELVHYDIPWSLIRIEQRNGRIDRYGQRESPRITALVLEPSHERFRGDLRVLARLMDKEHEAHTALGDVASLMGEYSVSAEEDAIRDVLAGEGSLDEVVRPVEDVIDGDDLASWFADFDFEGAPDAAVTGGDSEDDRGTGLYREEIDYLDDALRAGPFDPTGPAAAGGVQWTMDRDFGVAQLVPPPDLVQRLEVLPQTYLAERRVTEKLTLATTLTRGKDRLTAASADRDGSGWPDAHFLAPLHPVLDWAADRALATLGRNQVFAVRGTVQNPTVLLLGTLTNRRGQVVATGWLSVEFPDAGTPSFGLVTTHPSAAEALRDLGLAHERSNPGPVADATGLQQFIGPAVDLARSTMSGTLDAAAVRVAQVVEERSKRLARWEFEADALIQRSAVKQQRTGVRQEQELVAAMAPDRQLVRPLVVVVPDEEGRL
ncbi:helicase-related protein [Nakamurella sp.]|uniref:helicase-related protein n=1 Tax=Nakamurella sp. TaxID=1869182 RepID=UPI003B3AD6E9